MAAASDVFAGDAGVPWLTRRGERLE